MYLDMMNAHGADMIADINRGICGPVDEQIFALKRARTTMNG
jgi:hypothetical protein